jgi:two-component system LytT family response regulator
MTESKRIRVVIVDDEKLARQRLAKLLSEDPEIQIVGECADGPTAVALIAEQAPDLLFLDVQMPAMDGFAILETISVEHMPLVIFVTAYDQYAVQAFEIYALDYLLKPFGRKRFALAMQRAKAQLQQTPLAELARHTRALLQELKTTVRHPDRLVIKNGGRIFFLKATEIDWIEAQDNYVCLHVGKTSYLLRETINNLEMQLGPKQFLRIHRGTLVNVDRIQELQPWFSRDYRVILRDGTQLTMSRRYRVKLRAFLGDSV